MAINRKRVRNEASSNQLYQPRSLRQKLDILHSDMERERTSYEARWANQGRYILPSRTRFLETETNEGRLTNQAIIDTVATKASRSFAAGMMSGTTNPAIPWFRLAQSEIGARESLEVKTYLEEVRDLILSGFLRSNLYQLLA